MLIFEQVSIDEVRAHNRELADGYVSFRSWQSIGY
jgi:hypothetical protein